VGQEGQTDFILAVVGVKISQSPSATKAAVRVVELGMEGRKNTYTTINP
jgi:hypothetical protein